MYSSTAGIIYIFNLIVGTGALALPKAMAAAGWLISVILLFLLGTISYVTTTFVVEALSIGNALARHKRHITGRGSSRSYQDSESGSGLSEVEDGSSGSSSSLIRRTERKPLLDTSKSKVTASISGSIQEDDDVFAITKSLEMGEMAAMFFSKFGNVLFYLCIIVYLYGDLAIYAAAVPKSLRDIACQSMSCSPNNVTRNTSDSDICWGSSTTRMDVYRIFLAIFTVTLGPFAYFNVQKTKYLQFLTTVLRWIAFVMMIVLAVMLIAREPKSISRPLANFREIPNLFGVSVYSFMCQHSLPSLVTPVRNKRSLRWLLLGDYLLIYTFYVLLGVTAIFAFDNDQLMDIYTLNFQDSCHATSSPVLRYFLGLFPVFTLSSNFPIIALTLTNNLRALGKACVPSLPSSFVVDRLLFPTLALCPPIVAAFITNDITSLVGYTGSYAGAGVQYVIPGALVLLARREGAKIHGDSAIVRNQYRSPFIRRGWIVVIMIWTVVCLVFVTTNHIISKK